MCPKDSTVVGIINTVFEPAADDGRMNYSAKENLQRYEVQGRKYEVLKSGGRSPAEFTTFNISTNSHLTRCFPRLHKNSRIATEKA